MENVVLRFQEVNLRPSVAFIGDFVHIPEAPESSRFDWPHQICDDQLGRALDVVFSRVWMGQFLTQYGGSCSLHEQPRRTLTTDGSQRKYVELTLRSLDWDGKICCFQPCILYVGDGYSFIGARVTVTVRAIGCGLG